MVARSTASLIAPASRGSTQRLPLTFLPDVKRGLEHCGTAWIELEHAEVDDMIATVVHATPAPRPVIIMSRDRDYYQLITDRVAVLNTRFRAGRKLVTPDEVYHRHQVTPTQWADYRALAGDPADEIPGVHGIGAKTAATLLDGGLTLDDLTSSGRLATGRPRAVAEQFELALKWRDMIRLIPAWNCRGGPPARPVRSCLPGGSRRATRPVVIITSSVLTIMAHPDDAEAFAPVPILGRLPITAHL